MSVLELSPEDIERAHGQLEVSCARESRRVDPDSIAVAVAGRHGVSLEDMLGPGREAHLVEARADVYRALRAAGWSYPRIGRFVGGRNHTTVMHALGGRK